MKYQVLLNMVREEKILALMKGRDDQINQIHNLHVGYKGGEMEREYLMTHLLLDLMNSDYYSHH